MKHTSNGKLLMRSRASNFHFFLDYAWKDGKIRSTPENASATPLQSGTVSNLQEQTAIKVKIKSFGLKKRRLG